MQRVDFRIGEDFWCDALRWRCTDIGTRTVTAICLDRREIVSSVFRLNQRANTSKATSSNVYEGPPYWVREYVFDEDTFIDCSKEPHEPIILVLNSSNSQVTLPGKLIAQIWRGVRRGEITNVEEHVHDIMSKALGLNKEDPTPGSSAGVPDQSAPSA